MWNSLGRVKYKENLTVGYLCILDVPNFRLFFLSPFYDYIWLAGFYYSLSCIFIQARNTGRKARNIFLYCKNFHFYTCLEKDSGNRSAAQWTWSAGWIVFGKHP